MLLHYDYIFSGIKLSFKMAIISLIAIISGAIYRTTKSCYRDRPNLE